MGDLYGIPARGGRFSQTDKRLPALPAPGAARPTPERRRLPMDADPNGARQGAAAFRIEFLNESGDEVRRTMNHYEALLRNEIGADTLWQELKLINQLGVTRGTLER